MQDCTIISDAEVISAEGKPMAVGVVSDPLWEATKNKNFGCLADGEAALPPSKRLHRALEAMSTNVAEDEPISPGGPSALKMIVNGSISQKGTEESVVQKSNSPSNGVCGNLAPPVEQMRQLMRSIPAVNLLELVAAQHKRRWKLLTVKILSCCILVMELPKQFQSWKSKTFLRCYWHIVLQS
ncbi:hypothetical protein Tco_0227923 [Tanacetum coccineum]